MHPLKIIAMAEKDGICLSLTTAGKVKAIGNEAMLSKWLPTIKEFKLELIKSLRAKTKEFELLYEYLAPLHGWIDLDYQAWISDLESCPDETINCLRALKSAWNNGRYGCPTQEDWGRQKH